MARSAATARAATPYSLDKLLRQFRQAVRPPRYQDDKRVSRAEPRRVRHRSRSKRP